MRRKRRNEEEDDYQTIAGEGDNFGGLSKRFKPASPDRATSYSPRPQQQPSATDRAPQLDISRLLPSLEREQLVSILTGLLSNHPSLEQQVTQLLPRPTLASTTALLTRLETRLNEAYPYSKLGPDSSSDYAFNRVRPNLVDMKDVLIHHFNTFVRPESYPPHLSHEYASNSFGYLHLATSVVHRLPTWQTERHNVETKGELYEKLGEGWRAAAVEVGRKVKEEGKMFGAAVVGEWARNLNLHMNAVKGGYGFDRAWEEFRRQLGWMIGLDDGDRVGGGGLFGTGIGSSQMPFAMNGMMGFQAFQQQQLT
ncbi:Tethering factor for nuclear proteasome sts1 [Rhizophlyctis rosea]|nr:Tethering factor for nuclear proteasome sts1 [Rhizophlyctis rosea]